MMQEEIPARLPPQQSYVTAGAAFRRREIVGG